MLITFLFRHFQPREDLKEYAREKSEKLKKYFEGNVSVAWSFDVSKKGTRVHCHLTGNHMDFSAEEMTEEFLEGIDKVIDKVERQIRKHKEILKNHHHKEHKKGA